MTGERINSRGHREVPDIPSVARKRGRISWADMVVGRLLMLKHGWGFSDVLIYLERKRAEWDAARDYWEHPFIDVPAVDHGRLEVRARSIDNGAGVR